MKTSRDRLQVSPCKLAIHMLRNQPPNGHYAVVELARWADTRREDIYETLSHLIESGFCRKINHTTFVLNEVFMSFVGDED